MTSDSAHLSVFLQRPAPKAIPAANIPVPASLVFFFLSSPSTPGSARLLPTALELVLQDLGKVTSLLNDPQIGAGLLRIIKVCDCVNNSKVIVLYSAVPFCLIPRSL